MGKLRKNTNEVVIIAINPYSLYYSKYNYKLHAFNIFYTLWTIWGLASKWLNFSKTDAEKTVLPHSLSPADHTIITQCNFNGVLCHVSSVF